MPNKIIDTADESARKTAAGQAHGLVYIDKVLKTKTDGYLVQLTLGWTTPADTMAPVATISMPAPFAEELANTLLEACKQAAEARRTE